MISGRNRNPSALTLLNFSIASWGLLAGSSAHASGFPFIGGDEDFKGSAPAELFKLGVMGGLGIVDANGMLGFTVAPSFRIVEKGFVPDINNQVFAELSLGGNFLGAPNAFTYSAHLRWDFVKNSTWTYYAVGGVAGNSFGGEGGRWSLAPRFGVGTFYRVDPRFAIRAEVSHEFTGLGVSFDMY